MPNPKPNPNPKPGVRRKWNNRRPEGRHLKVLMRRQRLRALLLGKKDPQELKEEDLRYAEWLDKAEQLQDTAGEPSDVVAVPADEEELKRMSDREHVKQLVSAHALIPTPNVYIPAWLAELYLAMTTSWRRFKNLGLPQSSVKDKLPYHKDTETNPERYVTLPPMLAQAAKLHRAGVSFEGPDPAPEQPHHEMPRAGVKHVLAVDILLIWFCSRVRVR